MSVEYRIKGKAEVTKDGHTMFFADIVMDLQRKSFLECENMELKNHIKNRHKADEEIHQLKEHLKQYNEISSKYEFIIWMKSKDQLT